MIVLVKLILSHLIGDFILQPKRWVKQKEEKKLKSLKLVIHSVLHGVLSWLLIWDYFFWKSAVIIALTHWMIDGTKLFLQTGKSMVTWFIVDQSLHILIILAIWYAWEKPEISPDGIMTGRNLVLITALVALTSPTSTFIRVIISKWTHHTEDSDEDSLRDAGKYIGILERLFVFAFVWTNHWEAVGFLIAAKSVFRFGDLRESKDRKLTEYILIGTLLSFGTALVIGAVSKSLLTG